MKNMSMAPRMANSVIVKLFISIPARRPSMIRPRHA